MRVPEPVYVPRIFDYVSEGQQTLHFLTAPWDRIFQSDWCFHCERLEVISFSYEIRADR